jgi:diguanylate cyclase (GGDEF)-like protein/PAS domain S-box-containing protein
VGLPDLERDQLEIASLLHDVGKMGVPDLILLKPSQLSEDEYLIMERHRRVGADILRSCCASQGVLDIVHDAGAWFDGSRDGYELQGDALSHGARMVAIVDAFDAMTSDQVYRRALSRERALAELFEFAGTQFDPRLVQEFCSYINADQVKLQAVVARQWLKVLQPQGESHPIWQLSANRPPAAAATSENLFCRKLLENMHDAVVFVDSGLLIVLWNRAAERMTGIPAASVEHKHWNPTLVNLRDEKVRLLGDGDCPVILAIKNGAQTLRRLSVMGRGGQRVEIDAHLVPVYGKNGTPQGAAVVMHDASSQVTLEQRIQCLHEKATRDPLTQVANRGEFDRILANYVSRTRARLPCSLILCDLDFFKKINDTFGHQAGDEVLITFAALLQALPLRRSGRPLRRRRVRDAVRDCDNATATRRAEELRVGSMTSQWMRRRKCISASFGVTEVQSGDTPDTMLRRADRALFQAKSNGRNTVVQLGSEWGARKRPPRAPAGSPGCGGRPPSRCSSGSSPPACRLTWSSRRCAALSLTTTPRSSMSPKTISCSRSMANKPHSCGGPPIAPCRSPSCCDLKSPRSSQARAEARWCGPLLTSRSARSGPATAAAATCASAPSDSWPASSRI